MTTSSFRPEIQGLRAVAVLAVLAYHLWPSSLQGGFVGVDVFFVISGYLITGLLLADAEAHGSISVARFYSRRIKRLLPAATIVLLAVASATALLSPEQRSQTAFEIAASALYVQNHWLAHQSLDYLTADDSPGLLQHFWSLSVEEQYYIGWPLLFAPLSWLVPERRARPRSIFLGIIAAVFVASLAHSIQLTAEEASTAYFATSTRAWELALGGALSLMPRSTALGRVPRQLCGLLGLLAIGFACLRYSHSTPFPGYFALLPCLGAVLVIVADNPLLRSAPMQFFGDISYSLYLWHWPALILFAEVVHHTPERFEPLCLFLAVVALAVLTKRFVEDPCRAPSFASARAYQPFALAAGCIAVSLGAAFAVHASAQAEGDDEAAEHGDLKALGARALDQAGYDFRRETTKGVVPALSRARMDLPSASHEDCLQTMKYTEVKTCEYHSAKPKFHIALIGDSHAAQFFPAFQALTTDRALRFSGISKEYCPFSLDPIFHPQFNRDYVECLHWSEAVIEWLAKHRPDLVLIAQAPRQRARQQDGEYLGPDDMAHGLAKAWRKVDALGLRLMAIGPTPWFPTDERPAECVRKSADWQRQCVKTRAEVFPREPVALAAAETDTPLIDLRSAFCGEKLCPPIIGGVFVYRDQHHITATYAQTLADRFKRALQANGVRLPH